MKLLPLLVRVKIAPPDRWVPTLWLPVFLIWPLAFLLLFPVFVVGLLITLVVAARELPSLLTFFGGVYTVLCELRGTLVDVRGGNARVLISIS